ncbi:MAG: asparagine synthase (glutamine-hydrolyzing) [Acidobacteria bacterium]|nr:asparagine synthase (glutamine-hydrolyzing) [Acidobacteriota bacterium]MCI0724266.1 asparagine synthase (glutamine-hydrolyzing) [Acidobacteriota bacterium]
MCGIFGCLNLSPDGAISPELISQMSSQMVHRGPDDKGVFACDSAVIGMQRLSIIDVLGGHQPLSNEDETVWVVCNGEIYNYLELQKELKALGHRFRCSSDTEVLAHLYEERGERLVEKLRGMFGFAIWDRLRRRLVVGRDRLGIKPLYYCQTPRQFLFASEIKSLLVHPAVARRVDPAALNDYLAWGYVPAPRTLFQGIHKLPPGHLLIAENGNVRVKRYWELPVNGFESHTEEEWAEALREKLTETVRSHLISDVPLGAFLSGGLDSSSIVGLMAKLMERPVKSFSIGFGEEVYNELPYAKVVAEAFGTEHHEIMVRPDVFELLPKLIWHLDEPIADSAFITTFLVSEFARKSVTVILSGVGGDELFGGYRRYLGSEIAQYYDRLPRIVRQKLIPAVVNRLPVDRNSNLRNYFRLARAFVSSSHLTPESSYLRYLAVFNPEGRSSLYSHDFREELNRSAAPCLLEQHLSSLPSTDLKSLMMLLDLKTQLPDDLLALSDKMSMAASLECRVPFLDHEFVEFAARVPSELKVRGFEMKYLFKKAMKPLLPESILNRPKRGFGAPFGAWLRGELRPLALEILSERNVRQRGFFEWPAVQSAIDLHFAEREDHTDHLLALINFELWCRIYIDGNGLGAKLDPASVMTERKA